MSEGSDPSDDKTEEPTPKKMLEARRDGKVVMSQELKSWLMLGAALAFIVWLAGSFFARITPVLQNFIARPHEMPMDSGALNDMFLALVQTVAGTMVPVLGMFFVVGFCASFLQVGPLLTTKPLEPNLDKLNPLNGAKRYFSAKTWVEFAKSCLKLVLVSVVVAWAVAPFVQSGDATVGKDVVQVVEILRDEAKTILIFVLSIYAAFVAADYAWQRYSFYEQMRMSKQEVKDEYKQSEGDPQVKAKLKQLRAQRARRRMMQRVPEADVVITNPTHFAVALKYDREKMNAPVLVAKGMDLVALKIREIATANNVPIQESPPLARGLYDAVELDQEIPEEFYKAVAEVISYVFSRKRG